MFERSTSTDTVVAGVTWAVVVGLYIIAGGILALGELGLAILVAEVACGVSAYAAVRHIRCYVVRMCELLRRIDARRQEPDPSVPLQRIH